MELHAVQLPVVVRNGRLGCVGGVGQTHKTVRKGLHRVAMTHPHRGAIVNIGEQIRGVINLKRGLPVFRLARGGLHHTSQLLHHQLHPVADPKHRNPEVPDLRIAEGSPLGVDRAGPTTEDDPGRSHCAQLSRRCAVTEHKGEHFRLAHTARNQLGILRTEVENDNRRLALAIRLNLCHRFRWGRGQTTINPSA